MALPENAAFSLQKLRPLNEGSAASKQTNPGMMSRHSNSSSTAVAPRTDRSRRKPPVRLAPTRGCRPSSASRAAKASVDVA